MWFPSPAARTAQPCFSCFLNAARTLPTSCFLIPAGNFRPCMNTWTNLKILLAVKSHACTPVCPLELKRKNRLLTGGFPKSQSESAEQIRYTGLVARGQILYCAGVRGANRLPFMRTCLVWPIFRMSDCPCKIAWVLPPMSKSGCPASQKPAATIMRFVILYMNGA